MIGYYAIDEMIDAGIRTGFGDEWVRVGGMKLTCDGSISERTARLSEPYVGRPDDYGIIVMQEDKLYEYAHKVHMNDWQIGIHANGDVGIDIALNVNDCAHLINILKVVERSRNQTLQVERSRNLNKLLKIFIYEQFRISLSTKTFVYGKTAPQTYRVRTCNLTDPMV